MEEYPRSRQRKLPSRFADTVLLDELDAEEAQVRQRARVSPDLPRAQTSSAAWTLGPRSTGLDTRAQNASLTQPQQRLDAAEATLRQACSADSGLRACVSNPLMRRSGVAHQRALRQATHPTAGEHTVTATSIHTAVPAAAPATAPPQKSATTTTATPTHLMDAQQHKQPTHSKKTRAHTAAVTQGGETRRITSRASHNQQTPALR